MRFLLADSQLQSYTSVIMGTVNTQTCSTCQRREAELVDLRKQLADTQAELAKAKKNSTNSSKPPSSDITSAKTKKKKTKSSNDEPKKKGAQFGHKKNERLPFTVDDIDHSVPYRLEACPCCSGPLQDADLPSKTVQQVELVDDPIVITEHQRIAQQCTRCRKLHYAAFPQDLIKAGLVGPRLTALVGFLKGPCHMSYSCIRKFFRDVLGLQACRGLLAKLVHKVSDSLEDAYEQLFELLPEQDILNVDETGHKNNGDRMWTWCFRAALFTLFKISPSRGSNVLIDVLGEEFDGVLGCDYFSAYRKYMKDCNVLVQFCLAHFIRDVKFLAKHPDEQNRLYGEAILEQLRKLFGTIHRRDEYPTEAGFHRAMGRVRNDLVWAVMGESPHTREALNLEARFDKHVDSYFLFITTPGVEPTNNLAEQAIRFVAIHRRLTQGTRSEAGQSWCERIWTVVQTCTQQGQSIFDFLYESVTAHFNGEPTPSLLPDTS